MISLIVYKKDGKYQSDFEVGKEPVLPNNSLYLFRVREDFREDFDATMKEVNRQAVEKAEKLGLGKVVGLPDKSELE